MKTWPHWEVGCGATERLLELEELQPAEDPGSHVFQVYHSAYIFHTTLWCGVLRLTEDSERAALFHPCSQCATRNCRGILAAAQR